MERLAAHELFLAIDGRLRDKERGDVSHANQGDEPPEFRGEESRFGHGSMTRCVPKTSRTCGQADVTILDCLFDCGTDQARQQARRIGRATVPGPAPGGWERLVHRAFRPSGVANERCHSHPVRHRAGRPARLRTALAPVYRNGLQALELRPRLAPWRASGNRGVVSRARFFFIFLGRAVRKTADRIRIDLQSEVVPQERSS